MTTPREAASTSNPFQDVDTSAQPDYWVRYLDAASAMPELQAGRTQSIEALALHPGDAVLDVGCGAGDVLFALAGVVGAPGRAMGIDLSAVMLAETSRRAEKSNAVVSLSAADAARLPFADSTFNACRIERVLIHVESQEAVLAEMVRVVARGGRIVAFEPDFGTRIVDLPDRDIFLKLARWRNERAVRNPWTGRQLYRRFLEAGLTDVSVDPITSCRLGDVSQAVELVEEQEARAVERARGDGYITAEEAQTHLVIVRESIASGRWFQAFSLFIATGTKP